MDILYALERAAIINEKIARKRILKNEEHDITDELAKWKVLTKGLEHPALELYRMRFAYTEEDQLEQYFALRDLFFEVFEGLNEKEQKIHFFGLLNNSTSLIRANKLKIKDTFVLYKNGLEKRILITDDKLNISTYVIALSISNYCKRFDFSAKLCSDYIKYLHPDLQNDAMHWASAHTQYWSKNLYESLNILIQYNFTNDYISLRVKMLMTQLYFDLHLVDNSYEEYLHSYFNSFEKWLSRNKLLSTNAKKSYLRFVQICRKLTKLNTEIPFDEERVKCILADELNIQAIEWIKDKIVQILFLQKKRNEDSIVEPLFSRKNLDN
ncbi:MAG: hypothetical protein AB8G22_16675 [Saprospiraceae bacterium]